MLARRLRTLASCFDSSYRMVVTVSCSALVSVCSASCVPVSSVWSKPILFKCCSALVTWVLGWLSAMGCMPAFSKNGLYFAITATVSTWGVPACGRVWFMSLVPKPMLLYFGWIITRLMVLISFCSCCMLPFQTLFLPKHIGGGWL